MAAYVSTTWTTGDIITETKLDNMVSNDQSEDAHAANGLILNNNVYLEGKESGGTERNLIGLDTSNNLIIGIGKQTLSYVEKTDNFATASPTPVQVTGLTTGAITIPTLLGRKVQITVYTGDISANATTQIQLTIWDGTVGSGTQLNMAKISERNTGDRWTGIVIAVVSPTPGSKTYNVGLASTASTTADMVQTATVPAFILVQII